jgi:hypothetical protein
VTHFAVAEVPGSEGTELPSTKIGKLTKSNAQGVKTESQVVLDSADGDLVAIDDSLGPRDDLRHKRS